MKKEKAKENNPILYEKYKRDHHLNEENDVVKSRESKEKVIGIIRHAITMIILVIMIFLSAIGTITILNEELRESCLELIFMSM